MTHTVPLAQLMDGYIVTFAYGRRGNTLATGIKNDTPVPLETATNTTSSSAAASRSD
ncbi:MAG: hypothetical protein RLZZ214_1586 [Verrucomicrobiota bacterium]|jgi:hypothetical protein